MAGRLQRMYDPDTNAVTGYVFDGRKYDAKSFEGVLRQLAAKNDPWAAKALELDDFKHLKDDLSPLTPSEITAQIKDLTSALSDPDVKDPEKRKNYRKRLEQLKSMKYETERPKAVQGPSGQTGGRFGGTQTNYQDPRKPSTAAGASTQRGQAITVDEYKRLRGMGYSDKEIRSNFTVNK